MIIHKDFLPLNEIVGKSKGICTDFTFFHILYRMLTIYHSFPKTFFMKESDFNIKPVSMSTKRIYFTAYFNYHEICTYWMQNVLKAPYNAHNLYIFVFVDKWIHSYAPQKWVAFFTLCEAWMGFFNNLGIISILFDCRRCTYLRVT